MKKIPTLFVRDPEDRAHVIPLLTEGCAWVQLGEGTATVKWDGTCTMLDEDGVWWARREVKPGKPVPPGYRQVEHDPVTGKSVGWEPMANSPFKKFHAEALEYTVPKPSPGTYELVGPKVQGNPHGLEVHILLRHGWSSLSSRKGLKSAPRTYAGLRDWLADWPYEGIVWHHPDGRMVKIKKRDFPPVDTGRD